MDIYEYLKKDHQKVAELFKLFEKNKDKKIQAEIFSLIDLELMLHAESEQETFYKKLEQYKDTDKIAHHGEKEHAEIENMLALLRDTSNINDKWVQGVLKLKEIVEHHVKEEEGEMFRDAKKVLSEEEAIIIKEKMHDYKDKMLIGMEALSEE